MRSLRSILTLTVIYSFQNNDLKKGLSWSSSSPKLSLINPSKLFVLSSALKIGRDPKRWKNSKDTNSKYRPANNSMICVNFNRSPPLESNFPFFIKNGPPASIQAPSLIKIHCPNLQPCKILLFYIDGILQ